MADSPAAADYIVNIDESNAVQILIEESQRRPVLVDFWADWCGPCKSLMPILEKLAHEYAGQFILAKVNADQQPMIAQQFGVRSLPTVILMQGGQPVDGFVGAQPESRIRELLEPVLPKPWDTLLQQGQALLLGDDAGAAIPLLKQAYGLSSERADIALVYAQALLAGKRLDEAEKVLEAVRLADRDAFWEQLQAQINIERTAARSPELTALEQQLATDPGNDTLRRQLAAQYSHGGFHREALESLYGILQRDKDHDNGATRKALLEIIASLGKGDPLAVEYQRKLYSLLY